MVIPWCSCILVAITSSSELIGIGNDFILFLTRIATPPPPLARFGFVCLSLKYPWWFFTVALWLGFKFVS